MTSANISNLAAYLRYFGVLFFGKGHLRAQVPSKASVSSAMINKMKITSAGTPVISKTSIVTAMMRRVKVSKSAKYLMRLIIALLVGGCKIFGGMLECRQGCSLGVSGRKFTS